MLRELIDYDMIHLRCEISEKKYCGESLVQLTFRILYSAKELMLFLVLISTPCCVVM